VDGNQGPDVVPAAPGGTGFRRAGHDGGSLTAAVELVTAVPAATDSAGLIDQLRDLEDLKSALAARQARLAVAFDVSQRREQADAGVPAAKLGARVGAQIALARRESPAKGGRLLGLAKALVTEMPHTLAALETGILNEWRATLLVRETACLAAADRAAVDEHLAADTGTLTGTGDLIAMDSRARIFPTGLRRLIQARDHTCRTPYCDAPIRHLDHIVPHHAGGQTTGTNGAGLCEACNHTKETPGWNAIPRPGPRHTLELTTPTGHTYHSTAPPLPGTTLPGTPLRPMAAEQSRHRRRLAEPCRSASTSQTQGDAGGLGPNLHFKEWAKKSAMHPGGRMTRGLQVPSRSR
jgi:hypothetical protein